MSCVNNFFKGACLFLMVAAIVVGFSSAVDAADLINGGRVSGAISTGGEIDSYTFAADAGDHIEIQIADLTGNSYYAPRIELYGPGGGDAIAVATNNVVARMVLTLEESGTYILLVQDNSGVRTGDYNIYYVNLPVDEHGPLVNGGVVSESIDLGDLDTFSFTADAGDHIEIQIADPTGNSYYAPRIELYGPGGGDAIAVATNNVVARMVLTLEESGTYILLVQDNSGVRTGDYNIYYVNLPVDEHGPLVNGGVVSESIDLGDLDTFSFTGEAGDHIEIQIADLTGNSYYAPRIELYGPGGGDAIAVSTNNVVARMVLTLEDLWSGTYILLVQDNSGVRTGDYNIYYVNLPVDEHGPLVNGGVVSESIDLGDLDTFSFTADAGDHIEIQIADLTGNSYYAPRIELYGPGGGDVIAVATNNVVARMVLTLEESGTYILLVQDNSGVRTGDYNIYYIKIPGAKEHGEIENSDLASETIDLGDIDTYTIVADVGDTLEFLVSDLSTNGALSPLIKLYGPSGALVASGSGHKAAYLAYTVGEIEAGAYTLVITDYNGTGFGEYLLSCYNDAWPIPYCKYDFDDDKDIDGEDLIDFSLGYDDTYKYDLRGLEIFAASFGKLDCEASE